MTPATAEARTNPNLDGWRALEAIAALAPNRTPAQVTTLVLIARWTAGMHRTSHRFSLNQLATQTGLSRRTIMAVLPQLHEAGDISIDDRGCPPTSQPKLITLTLDRPSRPISRATLAMQTRLPTPGENPTPPPRAEFAPALGQPVPHPLGQNLPHKTPIEETTIQTTAAAAPHPPQIALTRTMNNLWRIVGVPPGKPNRTPILEQLLELRGNLDQGTWLRAIRDAAHKCQLAQPDRPTAYFMKVARTYLDEAQPKDPDDPYGFNQSAYHHLYQ